MPGRCILSSVQAAPVSPAGASIIRLAELVQPRRDARPWRHVSCLSSKLNFANSKASLPALPLPFVWFMRQSFAAACAAVASAFSCGYGNRRQCCVCACCVQHAQHGAASATQLCHTTATTRVIRMRERLYTQQRAALHAASSQGGSRPSRHRCRLPKLPLPSRLCHQR